MFINYGYNYFYLIYHTKTFMTIHSLVSIHIRAQLPLTHKNADADNGNYSPKSLNCDWQILPPTVPKIFSGLLLKLCIIIVIKQNILWKNWILCSMQFEKVQPHYWYTIKIILQVGKEIKNELSILFLF